MLKKTIKSDGGEIVYYTRERSRKIQLRIKLPDSKEWIRISSNTDSLEMAEVIAEEKYQELKYRVKFDIPVESKRFKDVASLAIRQLETEISHGNKVSSYKHYLSAIRLYHIPFFGNTHIDNITNDKMREFDEWRKDKLGRIPSKSVLNNHNAALRRIFRIAFERGWIRENQIPKIDNTGVKANRRPAFTRDEYNKLVRAAYGKWMTNPKRKTSKTLMLRELLRDYILIIANSGIRPGTEADNLKWNNIEERKDIDGETYLVFHVNGKTGRREPLAEHYTIEILRRIQSRFSELSNLDNKELFKVDEYVFRLRDGSRPKDLTRVFKNLLIYTGLLKDVNGDERKLYSLRHSYITWKLQEGEMTIYDIASQCGNSVNVIERHYSHVIPSDLAKRIVGKKPDWLKKRQS